MWVKLSKTSLQRLSISRVSIIPNKQTCLMRFLCFQYGSIHRDHWPAGLLCQQSRHSCLHQVGEGTLRSVHCLRHQTCNDLLQLRTPFNWLLMNLSATELVMAVTGNPILAYNSFQGKWCFSETICRINALGMTFLGKGRSFQLRIATVANRH